MSHSIVDQLKGTSASQLPSRTHARELHQHLVSLSIMHARTRDASFSYLSLLVSCRPRSSQADHKNGLHLFDSQPASEPASGTRATAEPSVQEGFVTIPTCIYAQRSSQVSVHATVTQTTQLQSSSSGQADCACATKQRKKRQRTASRHDSLAEISCRQMLA